MLWVQVSGTITMDLALPIVLVVDHITVYQYSLSHPMEGMCFLKSLTSALAIWFLWLTKCEQKWHVPTCASVLRANICSTMLTFPPIIVTHKGLDSSCSDNMGPRVWATMTCRKLSANLEWTCIRARSRPSLFKVIVIWGTVCYCSPSWELQSSGIWKEKNLSATPALSQET